MRGSYRRALAFAPLTLLAACNSGSDYDQYYQAIKEVWNNPGGDVSVSQAAAIPYATIGYRVGDGRQKILVLASDTQGSLLWTSAEHVVITTKDGRIVRTVGLEHDISAPAAASALPKNALNGPAEFRWVTDFPELGRYSIPITCKAAPKGREAVSILGQDVETVRVEEACRSDVLDWSFTDDFWIQPDGALVWRSIQHIHPDLDPVEIELLRPPG